MSKKNNFVEIGSGDDNSINWDVRFESLNDIDSILIDYESVDKEINNNELTRILEELRDFEATVPSAESFNEAFNLIEDCVCVEQELFDPDMPTSSQWKKISVNKSKISSLLTLINRAKELFQEIWEKDGIQQMNAEILKSANIIKKQEKEKIAKKQIVEFESQISKLLIEVNKVFEKKTGIHHLHPYLINCDDETVLVLTIHKSYRKIRSDLEKKVTTILKNKFKVFEIEESSPPGSGYIPYFAGNHRLKEMGWEQNKSVLLHPDENILRIANEMREKHITSTLEQ